jgi:hypothetical protein
MQVPCGLVASARLCRSSERIADEALEYRTTRRLEVVTDLKALGEAELMPPHIWKET